MPRNLVVFLPQRNAGGGGRKLVEKVAEMSVADMELGTPYEIVYGNDATCLEELRFLNLY